MTDDVVHLTHCNQGEQEEVCKYGDDKLAHANLAGLLLKRVRPTRERATAGPRVAGDARGVARVLLHKPEWIRPVVLYERLGGDREHHGRDAR